MKDDFEKKLAKEQQEGLRRCLTEEPPPGMLPDGTLNVVEPGLPRQKPTIRLTRKLARAIVLTGGPRTSTCAGCRRCVRGGAVQGSAARSKLQRSGDPGLRDRRYWRHRPPRSRDTGVTSTCRSAGSFHPHRERLRRAHQNRFRRRVACWECRHSYRQRFTELATLLERRLVPESWVGPMNILFVMERCVEQGALKRSRITCRPEVRAYWEQECVSMIRIGDSRPAARQRLAEAGQ